MRERGVVERGRGEWWSEGEGSGGVRERGVVE